MDKADDFLHQEDKFGGKTSREYTKVRGTENAYVSGREVGMSVRTAPNQIQALNSPAVLIAVEMLSPAAIRTAQKFSSI